MITDRPWTAPLAYEQNMDFGGSLIPESYSIFVDSTDDEIHYVGEAYTEANANLFAAAPELYEALADIRRNVWKADDERGKLIDVVLAKANPEQER